MNRLKYYIAIILLCAIAGIAVKFLILSPETEALIYMDSKLYDDAMIKYERILGGGNESGNVIIPLARIYTQQGEVKKAVGLLIRYIHKKPDLLNAETVLSSIYKHSISQYEYLHFLERVPSFSYPNEVLMDVSAWYESTLQDEKQIAVLSEMAEKIEDKRVDHEYRKLVYYYTSNTKFDVFSSLVKQLVPNANPKNRKEPLLFLLTILVSSEHYGKAMTFACKYLEEKRPPDPFEVEKIADIFLNAGQIRMADEICRRFLRKKDGRTTLQICKYRMDMAKGDECKVLEELRQDFNPSPAKSKRISDIGIRLAMKYGDSKLVRDILLQSDTWKLSEAEAFEYAFFALKTGDAELAEILNGKIGPDTLRLAPCLNFIIKAAVGKNPLSSVPSLACGSSGLDDDDIMQLAYIMFHNGCLKDSFLLIRDRPAEELFPFFKVRDLVKVIASCGNPEEFADRYEKELLLSKKPGRLLVNTLFLLSAVSGQTGRLEKLVDEYGDVPLPVLIDAYSLATAYGQHDSAVILAEAACRDNQGDACRYFLATSLLNSGNLNKALALLLKLKKVMRPAESLFLKTVALDIELCGLDRIPNEFRYEIEPALSYVLARKDMTDTELKRVSVCLAALGEREKAQRSYLKICQNENLNVSDIDEFASLCKRSPLEDVGKWFIMQAESGKWEKWRGVSWLNRIGMEKETVRIVEGVYRKVELDYLAEYLAALHETGNDYEAGKLLERYNISQLLKADLRERIALVIVLSKTGCTEYLRQLLGSFTAGELLSNLSPVDIASMFISTNKEKEGLEIFSGPGTPKRNALYVILFLKTYAGDDKFVSDWLDSGLENPESILINLYYFSLRNRRTGLALTIARRLYDSYATDGNRFRLAEALIAEKKYGEGVELVRNDAGNNNIAGEIYLSGISGLADTGKFSRESPEADRFVRICENILRAHDTPKPLLVSVAYALSNTGYHLKAKKIFHDFAAGNPDIGDSFTKMYLFSTAMAMERQDFALVGELMVKTKKEDEQKVITLLETYGMYGQIMFFMEKRYGGEIPLHLYPKYLNCLLKCRQMRKFDSVAGKLPPPQSFSDEAVGEIFASLMLAGKENEAAAFYEFLNRNKRNLPSALVRRLGYYFANNDDYEKAIPVLFELARASNEPESSDLSLLVTLPGIEKNQEFLDWLLKHAKISKGDEQLKWIEYLNFLKRPEEVVEILKEYYIAKEN